MDVGEVMEIAAEVSPLPGTRAIPAADFDALFVAESKAMVRLAFVMLSSQELAEEAVQEAFAKLYERWASIQRPGAYLRTVVINECRSRQRRATSARRKAHLIAVGEAVEQPLPELADALARLPYRRRAVVVLRHYQQLDTAEIAATLRMSEGTVKSTLHRGLHQLREMLT